jgi:hypothetical protein
MNISVFIYLGILIRIFGFGYNDLIIIFGYLYTPINISFFYYLRKIISINFKITIAIKI